MNKALRVSDYLAHILQAIERIERHTADVDEMGFLSSELIQDAGNARQSTTATAKAERKKLTGRWE